MEESIKLLDFETHDQMVQIHGAHLSCFSRAVTHTHFCTDYDGVSLFAGRDANQKAAAKEASALFQNHYPEFLVRPASRLSSSRIWILTHLPLPYALLPNPYQTKHAHPHSPASSSSTCPQCSRGSTGFSSRSSPLRRSRR